MGTRPIQIRLLPAEIQTAVAPFTSAVKEGELESISLDNFRTVSARCMEKMKNWEEAGREMSNRSPGRAPVLHAPRPPLFQPWELVPCNIETYRRLKQLIGLRPRNDDVRMADSAVVLQTLERKIQRLWNPLKQLAAFEHAPLVLSKLIGQLKRPDHFSAFSLGQNGNQLLARLPLYDVRTKHDVIRSVEISFRTNRLKGGMETFQGLSIKVDGRNIPPKEMPYILPNILDATLLWDYLDCDWSLFVGGIILFDFNNATLNDHAKVYLGVLASVMKEKPEILLDLTGHADSPGKSDYNRDLAKRRSESVQAYLIARLGSGAKERITASSVGEEKPIDAEEDGVRNNYNRHVSLNASSKLDGNLGCCRLFGVSEISHCRSGGGSGGTNAL